MKIINLLPKPKQQELKYQRVARAMQILIMLSVASFVCVFLAQGASRMYLLHEQSNNQKRIEQLSKEVNQDENGKVKEQITKINNIFYDYRKLAMTGNKWSRVLRSLVPLVPEGVSIRSLTVDPAKKSVTISGYSPTRELVIELHDRIQADSSHFINIDYPLENVAKPENVNYHFTFGIKEGFLQ